MIEQLGNLEMCIDQDTFIAPSADVIGQVTIGAGSSIWYNCVLRGDIAQIVVGQCSNVQDGSTVHVDTTKPALIGNYVTIGHNAIIHGCTIKDRVLIGMGAIVLNGAVIEEGAIVAAGTVVKENTVVPANAMIAGVPGKVVKILEASEQEKRVLHAESYEKLWRELYRK